MKETTIGERLKTIRKSLKLYQQSVASKLQITSQTLSRYETSARFPDSLFLQEFGKTYHVNANWLLYGRGDMFLKDPGAFDILNDKEKRFKFLFAKVEEIFKEMNR